MSRPALPPTSLLALAAVYTIWGSTYLALRWLVAEVPALLAAGARFVIAGGVLLAFGLLRRRPEDPRPTRRGLVAAAASGGLLFLVGNGFVSLAEKDVSSGFAAVLCGTMPLFVSLFGVPLGERLTLGEGVGLALGFVGVAVIGAGSLDARPASLVLLLLAQVGWAIGSLLGRRYGKELGGGTLPSALPMVFGGLLALAVALVRGERPPEHLPGGRALAAFAYLIVFGSIVAFTAYTHLLRTVTPALATSYAYVTPIVALLLGVLLGREHVGVSTAVGGAFVVVGVALVLRSRRPAVTDPSAGAGASAPAVARSGPRERT